MTLRTPVEPLGCEGSWQATAVGQIQDSFLLLVRH